MIEQHETAIQPATIRKILSRCKPGRWTPWVPGRCLEHDGNPYANGEKGYLNVQIKDGDFKRMFPAHRIIYYYFSGRRLPFCTGGKYCDKKAGQPVVSHLCHNRACLNFFHLIEETNARNCMRNVQLYDWNNFLGMEWYDLGAGHRNWLNRKKENDHAPS